MTFVNVISNNSNAIAGGGFLYAKSLVNTFSSFVKFNTYALLTNLTSEASGGSFYIDHPSFVIDIIDPIQIVNTKALNGKGGVFYVG